MGDRRPDPAIDRALKALNLVLQAGGFGVVAIDLADVSGREAAADSVYDVAARATRDRGERHGVRAADAGATGAQCRRPDVVAGRPLGVDWRVGSQPPVAGAGSPCACRVATEAD